jgi:NAD(P)-dependent dehydrogenase (short-subunit alcohol dehydrogenase family)
MGYLMSTVNGRLESKAAIVVGGGQTPGHTIGNGRATAIRFAQEGARVAVLDKRIESAQDTVDLIVAEGGEAFALEIDVTAEESCQQAISAALKQLGQIDILHNNVGIGAGDSTPGRITQAVWDALFDTNARSALFTCKAVLPHMRQRNCGSIINISSVAAIASATSLTAYKASKAALNAYTQALAINNARHGIRANVIMPGLMNTPMAIEGNVALGQDRDEVIARRDAAVPLNAQMGSGWDVANAALFLASDEAQFITGVLLPVDGGQSAKVG